MRTAAIVNPRSGGGRTAGRWPALAYRLAAAIGPFTTLHTARGGHAAEIAGELLAAGYERIVVVGGDGTLNEAVNGFMRAGPEARRGACLGFVPCGAGADFARSLGIPRDPGEAADALGAAAPEPTDVALARYCAKGGAPAERYWINMANIGIGAEVVRRRGARGGYLAGVALALLRREPAEVELALDGAAPRAFRICNVAVGNGAYQGAGMQTCPAARIDDGALEITVIADVSLPVLLRDRRMLYSGEIASHPKVTCLRASRVEARSSAPVPVEADGEALGTLPLEIETAPRAILVLRPARR